MDPVQVANACGDNPQDVAAYMPLVLAGLQRFGIDDHWTRIAAFATIATECDWHWLVELGDCSYLEGRLDLGNTQPGDGCRFRGRGFVQETGRANYTHASQVLGIDMVSNPDIAADPHVAGLTLGLYFKEHNIQAMANAQDWYGVRRAVNGGLNGIDRLLGCINNLVNLPDAPPPAPPPPRPAYPVHARVRVPGALKVKPDHRSNVAIDPWHRPADLPVGTDVEILGPPRPDPTTHEPWVPIRLVGPAVVHGFYLEGALQR